MKGHLILNIILLGANFGFTISNEDQRIINGNVAAPKQFPYQVGYDFLDLSKLQKPRWTHGCGGTLISKRIILTAANCFPNPDIPPMKIYFGAVDKSNNSEVGQQQLVVRRPIVVIHSDYDPSDYTEFFNNIALIKLPIDVAFDEYIRPAKLPQPDINYDSGEAIASGWGAIKVLADKTQIYQPKLKFFHTSIVSHAECKKRFYQGVIMRIAPSQICIAKSQNSLCRGDSGGPLAVRHNSDFVVLGITSNSFVGTCTGYYHSPEYTRVASYINWILENAGPHSLDE